MKDPAFRREPILGPQSFEMDESGLTQTVDGMLEGRDRYGLGIQLILLKGSAIDHCPGYSISTISTPLGRSVRSISIE